MNYFHNPTTRLEDLVEYYKSIKHEENLAYARIASGRDTSTVFRSLKQRRKKIEREYRGILNPEDCYEFFQLDELEQFLVSTTLFPECRVHESIVHEQAHCDAATRAGLSVVDFHCWLALTKRSAVTYALSTRVVVSALPLHEVYKQISTAPAQRSYFDLYH
ncbi:hypothetical protein HZB03_02220 [Candidatus Woesearchaeota archaeon]|nr:hypothetical protein [Candidatus Woesearchaeota archaeon]